MRKVIYRYKIELYNDIKRNLVSKKNNSLSYDISFATIMTGNYKIVILFSCLQKKNGKKERVYILMPVSD